MWMQAASIGLGAMSFGSGRRESKRMRRALDEQNRLMREGLDFQRQQYEDWENNYGGLRDRLIEDAERGVQGDFMGVENRASADVIQSFDKVRQIEARNLARYGVNPNSGRFVGSQRRLGLGQAAAEAGAINQGRETERRWADESTFARRSGVFGQGQGWGLTAMQGVGNAMNNLANSYGQRAQMHGNQAAQHYATGGQLIGYGLGGMGGGGGGGPMNASGIPGVPGGSQQDAMLYAQTYGF